MKRMLNQVETGDGLSFHILNVKVYDCYDTILKMVKCVSV